MRHRAFSALARMHMDPCLPTLVIIILLPTTMDYFTILYILPSTTYMYKMGQSRHIIRCRDATVSSPVMMYIVQSFLQYEYPTPLTSFNPEHPSPSSFRRLLLLISSIESNRTGMISAHIVQVLDLVDPDDPVLTRECFLQSSQLRAFRRKLRSSHPVLRLPSREQSVVIVVRHFVPKLRQHLIVRRASFSNPHQAVPHRWSCLIVNSVFTSCSEVVTLIDFLRPDAFRYANHPQELVDVVA